MCKTIPLNIQTNKFYNKKHNINITVNNNTAYWEDIVLTKYSSGLYIGKNEVIEVTSKNNANLHIGGIL